MRRTKTTTRSSGPARECYRNCRTTDALIWISACIALGMTVISGAKYASSPHDRLLLIFAALDVLLVLYLTVALSVLQRRRPLGALVALLITNGLLAASCVKMSVVGQPGLFKDLLLLPDLLRVLDPLAAIAGIAVCVIVIGTFLANLGWPRTKSEVVVLVPLAATLLYIASVVGSPSVARMGAKAMDLPPQGLPAYGHFYAAYGTFVRNAAWEHTLRHLQATSGHSLPQPSLGDAVLPAFPPRNVHIVVAESFTDPGWYGGLGLSEARMPPLFARWRAGPHSIALSPVFGNRSSNAEFEILCGVPAAVGPSEIVFWRIGPRALPCLPRLLRERGYESLSLVPSPPAIFNAAVAYQSIGFSHSVFEDQLDMSDKDGNFLSAQATLTQHFDRIYPLLATGSPVFSYVFINANHYPYGRNEARRPTVLQSSSSDRLIDAYVNGAYYVALAIDRFVERLHATDPSSLIIVVGDHAPPLGPDFEGYRQGGRIALDEPDPLRRAALYEVPLLIYEAGELLPLGRLPSYLIPYVVLDRLTDGKFCRRNGCARETPWRLRPFRDGALIVAAEGNEERLCTLDLRSGPCQGAIAHSLAWELQLLDMVEREAGFMNAATAAPGPAGR
jgi:Sulfatase